MLDRESLEAAEITAQRLGRAIAEGCPNGWRFLLFLCSEGPDGFMTHVSNIDRATAARMVEEWLGHLAGGASFTNVDVSDRCWCCDRTQGLIDITGTKRKVVICAFCLETLKPRPPS